MPKEVVQYPSTQGTDGSELSVHWTKGPDAPAGGYVQIAATRHVWAEHRSAPNVAVRHADHSHCSECVRPSEDTDYPARLAVAGSNSVGLDVPLEPATVFTDMLTRSEINQLIRVLRRARDQAFGEDA